MKKLKYPFNKPFIIGDELEYIQEAISKGQLAGNGEFTKKCHSYFVKKHKLGKALLTSSCTHALEMCALLIDVKEGDEIIMPSYTFVSTANAFALRGAKIVFADSKPDHPNIDETKLEALITEKTKAIVVVHYGGIACEMDTIKELTDKHNLYLIEDAAQAIDSYYKGKPLGSIGHLSTFSFHETKNIISGEGGLLGVNDPTMYERSEIIWEKGTNRSAFFRGEVAKYNWVDIGSSFLPSELTAAFLFAQLEHIEEIQLKRKKNLDQYFKNLKVLEETNNVFCPNIPDYATNNAHNFYLICNSEEERRGLISYLKSEDIMAVFHYIGLHSSPFYENKHDGRELINVDRFENLLVRMPLYYNLSTEDIDYISSKVLEYFSKAQ